jgi:hypothetical protein
MQMTTRKCDRNKWRNALFRGGSNDQGSSNRQCDDPFVSKQCDGAGLYIITLGQPSTPHAGGFHFGGASSRVSHFCLRSSLIASVNEAHRLRTEPRISAGATINGNFVAYAVAKLDLMIRWQLKCAVMEEQIRVPAVLLNETVAPLVVQPRYLASPFSMRSSM